MSKWVSCSSVTAVLDALEQDVSPYSNFSLSLSLCFILTDSSHTQASLLGSALSRGGWEELRGVHVTRGQLCQVSSVSFMWSLIILILPVRAEQLFSEKERPPHAGALTWMDYSPHWSQHSCASGKCFFFFFLKPLAHDKNHLNCLDCFKEDFTFNDLTVTGL